MTHLVDSFRRLGLSNLRITSLQTRLELQFPPSFPLDSGFQNPVCSKTAIPRQFRPSPFAVAFPKYFMLSEMTFR